MLTINLTLQILLCVTSNSVTYLLPYAQMVKDSVMFIIYY